MIYLWWKMSSLMLKCEKVDINRIVTDCLIEKYYEFGEIQPIIQTEKSPVWIYGNNLIVNVLLKI